MSRHLGNRPLRGIMLLCPEPDESIHHLGLESQKPGVLRFLASLDTVTFRRPCPRALSARFYRISAFAGRSVRLGASGTMMEAFPRTSRWQLDRGR